MFSSNEMINRSGRPVNKLKYLLITYIFGGIGGHHFYIGNTSKGIRYLCWSWTLIPCLYAIYDLFVAIFTPADSDGNIWL